MAKTAKLANADTGTTGHFISIKDKDAIEDIQPVSEENAIEVEQPDGSFIRSVAVGKLKWKWLPPHLRIVHIFKDLTGSLLSIGLLCDAGYTVTFIKQSVTVQMNGTIVLTGQRINKLWMIDIDNEENNPLPTSKMGHSKWKMKNPLK